MAVGRRIASSMIRQSPPRPACSARKRSRRSRGASHTRRGANVPDEDRRGGSAWNSPSFDPGLNLIYTGVGVPIPWGSVQRGTGDGDVLYTNSTLALDADTGEIVWYFQHIPNDEWDLDHPYARLVVETEVSPGAVESRDCHRLADRPAPRGPTIPHVRSPRIRRDSACARRWRSAGWSWRPAPRVCSAPPRCSAAGLPDAARHAFVVRRPAAGLRLPGLGAVQVPPRVADAFSFARFKAGAAVLVPAARRRRCADRRGLHSAAVRLHFADRRPAAGRRFDAASRACEENRR